MTARQPERPARRGDQPRCCLSEREDLRRLAVSVVLGRRQIAPRLGRFLERYPEVTIDLAMQDVFVDFVGQGIDLAIRVGEITDQSLVARKKGMVRPRTVASPAYLKANGAPRTPNDLKR